MDARADDGGNRGVAAGRAIGTSGAGERGERGGAARLAQRLPAAHAVAGGSGAACGLRVPRDRQGCYRRELLPFRKRRTQALEDLAAEMFLGGLSTRDVARVLERHFGERFDSKEISWMVAATSSELDAWRRRTLAGTRAIASCSSTAPTSRSVAALGWSGCRFCA